MTPTTPPLAGTDTCLDCSVVVPADPATEGTTVRGHAKKRFLAESGPATSVTEFAETFPKIPALVAHGTRCGKPTCRCTRGALHPTHYLRWREGRVQRRRYVRARDVPTVQAIIEQRRAQRRQERLALRLSQRTWRELARLVEDVEARLRAERGEP